VTEGFAQTQWDVVRLDAYLRERFADLRGSMIVEPAVGGLSNPTYFIGYDDWSVVLRKQPHGSFGRSAHAVDREFRVLGALHGSAVPVPNPILYCADPNLVGTPFYLMERLEGRVFFEYATPALTPEARRACYDSMCGTMAALHRFDWQAAGLGDYGRPGNYFERQIRTWSERWEQCRSADNPYIDRLIAWLRERVPKGGGAALCHGDFRLANLMFHATEPKVIGVLDWELSTIGHPLADVAFNVQAWRMTSGENGGICDRDLKELGIPSEEEYLDSYYRHSGSSERLTAFHMVFAMFLAAVGSASVAARGEAVQSPEAAAVGRRLAMSYALRGIEATDLRT
jgi:aminoglycoside phosphotransferase (APT) family kinase protein